MLDPVDELQASPQQKRLFFALCGQLGWDSEATKEKVKAKYKLDSFANINKDTLREVIDMLQKRTGAHTEVVLRDFLKMHLSFQKEQDFQGEYSFENFPQHLTAGLMKYFVIRPN